MVIIFDLDDTLYDEKTFVFSGFEQVANWLASLTSFSKEEILQFMKDDFYEHGRGLIFDKILERYYKKNKTTLKKCISIYRMHIPNIKLEADVITLLNVLKRKYPLYIVTDGNKLVQANKVKALGAEKYFKKTFITYRYGLKAAKPSLICFDKIKKLEKTTWEKMVYVGDNPKKDFVSLNLVNVITVRILKGDYSKLKAKPNYDAKYTINELAELTEILKNENR